MKDFLNSPIFILGNPRSGTSLFRIILNAHPNVVIPPESGFLQWWYPKYKNWNMSNFTKNEIICYVQDVLTSKKIEAYQMNSQQLSSYIFEFQPKNYAELSACIYLFYGRQKELKIWGDKNNYYINHIPLIKEIYPNAKFIHLVRDGRDVACSYKQLEQSIDLNAKYRPQLKTDCQEIAKEWVDNNNLIEKEIIDAQALLIRFEDVILSFEQTMRSVLTFLGLPWSDQLHDYPSYNDEPTDTLLWKMNTFKKPLANSIERYKYDLDFSEIRAFNEIASKTLVDYKYKI